MGTGAFSAAAQGCATSHPAAGSPLALAKSFFKVSCKRYPQPPPAPAPAPGGFPAGGPGSPHPLTGHPRAAQPPPRLAHCGAAVTQARGQPGNV